MAGAPAAQRQPPGAAGSPVDAGSVDPNWPTATGVLTLLASYNDAIRDIELLLPPKQPRDGKMNGRAPSVAPQRGQHGAPGRPVGRPT